jgi:hypothetical protein
MKTILTTVRGRKPLKTLSVNVTEEIINGAQPCKFRKCMVAEAIQQKYPSATYVWVDSSIIKFTLDGLRYWFLPPQNVKNYIAAYDRGQNVKPFKFITTMRVRVVQAGFYNTHPKGDNRTNPRKKYDPKNKRRKYGQKVRVNGVCLIEMI